MASGPLLDNLHLYRDSWYREVLYLDHSALCEHDRERRLCPPSYASSIATSIAGGGSPRDVVSNFDCDATTRTPCAQLLSQIECEYRSPFRDIGGVYNHASTGLDMGLPQTAERVAVSFRG